MLKTEQQVTPGFRCLSDTQIREIHRAILEVLERTGTEVYDEESLDLLRQAGAKIDGTRVRLAPGLVEWAIEAAPRQITLYDRDGRAVMDLSGSNVYFGPGPSCPNILDIHTGERRLVRYEDVVDYARLCDALPNIDFMMSMGIIADEPAVTDVLEFAAMATNTRKPIVAWSWTAEGAQEVLDIALAYRRDLQDLQESPFYLFYTEPSAPLRHSHDALQKLLFSVERRLPVIYGAGPVGGASSPVTVEGMIVTGAAEVLAGLVIAQLKSPGTPFVFGTGTGPIDMSTMIVAYGAPEFILGQVALCDIARYYQLPSWGFGGCSDAKLPDQQAAMQAALWNLMSGLAGANLVHDVGFLESGMTGSMESIVMNDEIVGIVKRLLGGIKVTPEELALTTIHDVGPGGHFLGTEHTWRHFRENWQPGITDRNIYEIWAANGKSTMGERARTKVLAILAGSQPVDAKKAEYIGHIIAKARQRTASIK